MREHQCHNCKRQFTLRDKRVPYCSIVCLLENSLTTNGECLEWNRSCDNAGYGMVRWQGVLQRTHRAMYEATKGQIPDGLVVRHTCDNPPCCNPNHLLLGTQKDNIRDCIDRGRYRNGRSK